MTPHRKRHFLIFTQPNCAYCGPVVKLVQRAADGLSLACEVVDATKDPARAAKFEVRSAPTVFLLNGATVLRSRSGRLTARELEAWLTDTNGG